MTDFKAPAGQIDAKASSDVSAEAVHRRLIEISEDSTPEAEEERQFLRRVLEKLG